MAFEKFPLVGAVTVIVSVQLVCPAPDGAAPNVAPDNDIVVAVKLGTPPQLVETPPVMVTPAGIVSLNAKPLIGVALKLVSVIVSVLVPPARIALGANTSVTVAPFCTKIVRVIVELLLAVCVEVIAPVANEMLELLLAAMVAALRVTKSASIKQLPDAGMDPPESDQVNPSLGTFRVPPHVVDILGMVAHCNVEGNVLLNATPVRA